MSLQNNVSGPIGTEKITAVPSDPNATPESDPEAGRYAGTDPADTNREGDSLDGELPAELDEDNLDIATIIPPLTSDTSTGPLGGDTPVDPGGDML